MKFEDLMEPVSEEYDPILERPRDWRRHNTSQSIAWVTNILRRNNIKPHSNLWEMYAEPQRFYHTADHVAQTFDVATSMCDQYEMELEVVILALAFHDVVYVPGGKHNEDLSALYAIASLSCSDERTKSIADAIRKTKGHRRPSSIEEAVVMDADLWGLGSEEEFDLNGENIIKEYLTVYDLDQVKAGRVAWITEFLQRDRIFHTALGAEREEQARDNLERERQALVGVVQ